MIEEERCPAQRRQEMQKMKAVHVAEPGALDKLMVGDRADPEAGSGEVVVRQGRRGHGGRDFFGKLVLHVP